jgi:radical SAM protein with 4Fe4S-binding SPASM domain
VDRFTRSKYLRNVEYITISGGEPTLREDFPEIMRILHMNIPYARFGITTHGMDPDTEERMFKRILGENPGINIGLVGLSVNGPPEVHDKTRGIKGSWELTMETYERLKDLVPCEFSFTFCGDNRDCFEWVCDLARKKGTRAYICWTVMNERFRVSEKDLVFWDRGMEKKLEEYLKKYRRLPRGVIERLYGLLSLHSGVSLACFYDHVIDRRNMPCYAGSKIVHVDPKGDVYPCNFKLSEDRLIGNLRQESFDRIWESMPERVLREIRNCECMYPNGLCGDSDIYPSVYNAPPFIIKWYLRKLLKNEPFIKADNERS